MGLVTGQVVRSIFFRLTFPTGSAIGLPMSIAEQIVAARKARGWTAPKLARKADVAEATVRAIEAGEACRAGSLERVAKALDLTVETTLVESPTPPGAQGAA